MPHVHHNGQNGFAVLAHLGQARGKVALHILAVVHAGEEIPHLIGLFLVHQTHHRIRLMAPVGRLTGDVHPGFQHQGAIFQPEGDGGNRIGLLVLALQFEGRGIVLHRLIANTVQAAALVVAGAAGGGKAVFCIAQTAGVRFHHPHLIVQFVQAGQYTAQLVHGVFFHGSLHSPCCTAMPKSGVPSFFPRFHFYLL